MQRPDTKATIAAAIANGIEVKMVTGDQTAIAKETCRQLGMGPNILGASGRRPCCGLHVRRVPRPPPFPPPCADTEVLNDTSITPKRLDKIIMEAHGFAEVRPPLLPFPS